MGRGDSEETGEDVHDVWEPLEQHLGGPGPNKPEFWAPGDIPGVRFTGDNIPPGEPPSELRPLGDGGVHAPGSWLILCKTSLNSLDAGEWLFLCGSVGEVGAGGEGGEVGAREDTSEGKGPPGEDAGEGKAEQEANNPPGDTLPLPRHHSHTPCWYITKWN